MLLESYCSRFGSSAEHRYFSLALLEAKQQAEKTASVAFGALLPEASHGLMNFLSALRNGEAIAVGEGVSMPMRICSTPPSDARRPQSATACFASAWSKEVNGSVVEHTVERWQRGRR